MLEIIKVMALQIAREIRCCPSPLACHGEKYQKHLEVCSSCRSKKSEAEDLTPWKDLADSLKPEQNDWLEPRVGQIRFVNNELSGWGANNNFYQSPMVVILEEISGTNGYQVAQVYSDETLQGPDDVAFEELGGFAEPWNVYTLHKKHFGECLGEVSEETVITIWNKFIDIIHDGDNEGISVSEATSLSSTEHEILREFRSLEYLVSNHVAKQSVALLMDEHETGTETNTVDNTSGKIFSVIISPELLDLFNNYYAADNYHLKMVANTRGTLHRSNLKQDDHKTEGVLEEITDEIKSQLDGHFLIPVRVFTPQASGETIINFIANKKLKSPEAEPTVIVECNGESIINSYWDGFPDSDSGLYSLLIPKEIQFIQIEIKEEQLNGNLQKIYIIFTKQI